MHVFVCLECACFYVFVCVNVSVSACVSRWLTCVCYSGPLPKLPIGESLYVQSKKEGPHSIGGCTEENPHLPLCSFILCRVYVPILELFIIFLVCFSTVIQPPAADLPAQEDPFSYQDLRRWSG